MAVDICVEKFTACRNFTPRRISPFFSAPVRGFAQAFVGLVCDVLEIGGGVLMAFSKPGKARYEVWPIEKERSIYRWQVVDLQRSAKIVARCSSREQAERVAKQLNEKGFVELL